MFFEHTRGVKVSYHYFSLQYSAIQKTVLRHDRLWSIAGISQILSELNEISFPEIARKHKGGIKENVIVAGGGKFTAKFETEPDAESAKAEIVKTLSTTLPMLEFQASEIIKEVSLTKAKEPGKRKDRNGRGYEYPGIIAELQEQKRNFRGYGVTFNPHLKVCPECGEYPADRNYKEYLEEGKAVHLCSPCYVARTSSKISLGALMGQKEEELTTMKRIYRKYLELTDTKNDSGLQIPSDFKNLCTGKDGDESKQRMAVWFSDLNNMNSRVPVWLSQEEDSVLKTFKDVKDVNIEIITDALSKTFPNPSGTLRFRLIVAGGDDLCIVMDSRFIIRFCLELSKSLYDKKKELPATHPLSDVRLEKNRDKEKVKSDELKPYSFGGSFIVTSTHTPFKKVHNIGESLMSDAKAKTDRRGNSVKWLIMAAEEEPISDRLIQFDKPLFIEKEPPDVTKKAPLVSTLSFREYIDLCKKFAHVISGSHIQRIITEMINVNNDSQKLEEWLMHQAAAEFEKSFSGVLTEPSLRKNGDQTKSLDCTRLATMLELLSIVEESEL